MGKECELCGFRTIFFTWTSTKNFPRHKLENKLVNVTDYRKKAILNGRTGIPLCYHCVQQLSEG